MVLSPILKVWLFGIITDHGLDGHTQLFPCPRFPSDTVHKAKQLQPAAAQDFKSSEF